MTKEFNTTPLCMINNSKIWRDIYYQNILKERGTQMVAIYCLLISLEMSVKADLILNNKDYSKSKKLQSLGHNFAKISKALSETKGCEETSKLFNIIIKDLRLDQYEDINVLRYPKKEDKFFCSTEYFKLPDNKIINLIFHIELKLNKFFIEKWDEE